MYVDKNLSKIKKAILTLITIISLVNTVPVFFNIYQGQSNPEELLKDTPLYRLYKSIINIVNPEMEFIDKNLKAKRIGAIGKYTTGSSYISGESSSYLHLMIDAPSYPDYYTIKSTTDIVCNALKIKDKKYTEITIDFSYPASITETSFDGKVHFYTNISCKDSQTH